MIKISKGLDLPISGSPINTISDEPKVSSVALLSNDFIGMKPTMLVKEGETVKAGQKIFEDKKNNGVYFTSPAGGIVKDINRGDKRRFLSIEIDIKDTEEFVNFDMDDSVDQIKDALESTPPELSADLVDMGLTLTGGGSLLKNIDKRFSKETGLPVHIADDPLSCVAIGTGKALEQEQTFSTMLTEY